MTDYRKRLDDITKMGLNREIFEAGTAEVHNANINEALRQCITLTRKVEAAHFRIDELEKLTGDVLTALEASRVAYHELKKQTGK